MPTGLQRRPRDMRRIPVPRVLEAETREARAGDDVGGFQSFARLVRTLAERDTGISKAPSVGLSDMKARNPSTTSSTIARLKIDGGMSSSR
jgi:hypothetical protein